MAFFRRCERGQGPYGPTAVKRSKKKGVVRAASTLHFCNQVQAGLGHSARSPPEWDFVVL